MSEAPKLKPCPCGKIPERLSIQDGSTYRWRYVGCPCDEWWIEASVRSADRNDADQIYSMCVDAWNAAPRRADMPWLPPELVDTIKLVLSYECGGVIEHDATVLRDIIAAVEGEK